MFSAILILLVMPFTDLSRSRGIQFKPLSKAAFFIFVGNFLILMELGAKHVESPFIEFGQISTVIYFAHFLIIVPLISLLENSLTDLSLKANNIKDMSLRADSLNIESPVMVISGFFPTKPLCAPSRPINDVSAESHSDRLPIYQPGDIVSNEKEKAHVETIIIEEAEAKGVDTVIDANRGYCYLMDHDSKLILCERALPYEMDEAILDEGGVDPEEVVNKYPGKTVRANFDHDGLPLDSFQV